MLTPQEHTQYARHISLQEIGLEGQEKLKKAKVLVIGAGGLGCPVLQYLTAAGVGTIGIIDYDKVDQTNLQRQVLYSIQDIGKPKVEAAIARLSGLNPYVNFVGYQEALTTQNAINLFQQYDIVVDGCDNFSTRYLVNDVAVLTGKPVVLGSIFKFDGQVSVYNYKNGPTYRCLYPEPPAEGTMPSCSEIGVLGVLPGVIGSLQANEVIKLICGVGDVLAGKLLTFDALSLNQLVLRYTKNETIKITQLQSTYELNCEVANIPEISLSEIDKDKYNLLDVRTNQEREINHLGGLHIPLNELENRMAEIPTNKPLVVYCKSGLRSKKAINLLEINGFETPVFNLTGGVEANINSKRRK